MQFVTGNWFGCRLVVLHECYEAGNRFAWTVTLDMATTHCSYIGVELNWTITHLVAILALSVARRSVQESEHTLVGVVEQVTHASIVGEGNLQQDVPGQTYWGLFNRFIYFYMTVCKDNCTKWRWIRPKMHYHAFYFSHSTATSTAQHTHKCGRAASSSQHCKRKRTLTQSVAWAPAKITRRPSHDLNHKHINTHKYNRGIKLQRTSFQKTFSCWKVCKRILMQSFRKTWWSFSQL